MKWSKCKQMAKKWCDKTLWIPPLIIRLVMGWIFLNAGWGKLNNLSHVVEFFQSLGIPFASVQAPFVAIVEFLGGIALILGVCSRFVALPLAITMIVALLTAKKEAIDSFTTLLGVEDFLYLLLLVAVMGMGSGSVSLDYWMCRKDTKR